MPDEPASHTPPETFHEFMAQSRAAFLYSGAEGRIVFANARFCTWLQASEADLIGTKVSDHFPIARKVYYETHLAPLLRMQGFFDGIAFDLSRSDGTLVPVFLSAAERHDETGNTTVICFSMFPAGERRSYERNLISAKTLAASDNSRLREQLAEDARARLSVEEHLATAQQAATLREQFIAVLGHDLRNPLAAIEGAMRLIAKTPLNERAASIVGMVHQSADRMAGLIDNVMDFARGRLGGGLAVDVRQANVAPMLKHVINELEIAYPSRAILPTIPDLLDIRCDAKRLGQLLSNLLANAIVHGAADGPILVAARNEAGNFVMTVSNTGTPIPPEAMERLFHPFTREDLRPSQQGLGLGLYIASEIARGHGGVLSVQSSTEETSFTLRMPAGTE